MEDRFTSHLDQLERQRRIAAQIMPADPLAAHRRILEKAMLVDPITRRPQVLAKITGADRVAEIARAVMPSAPDPLVAQRRVVEQMTRRPTDIYEQVVEQLTRRQTEAYKRVVEQMTGTRDPLAAHRRTAERLAAGDPLGRYHRIVADFDALLGGVIPTTPLAVDLAVAEAVSEGAALPAPSRAMVIHLLAIVWLCFCLISYGVGPALLGDVIVEALALAEYLSNPE